MPVKLRNGEHHRNPSGFYNKVKYLLRESKRDLSKLQEICNNIYYCDDVNFWANRNSWEAAMSCARSIIEHHADNPKDYLNSIYIYDRENRKTWYEKLCLK